MYASQPVHCETQPPTGLSKSLNSPMGETLIDE